MRPTTTPLAVQRTGPTIKPDSRRVLVRPFLVGNAERVRSLSARVLALSEAEVQNALADALADFAERHLDIHTILRRHYQMARAHFAHDGLSEERKLLLGAYFTSEYALESAAIFNPSIVPAPDQSYVPPGALRFLMSLRATGEGHISSIEFRRGLIDAMGEITLDAPARRSVTEPDQVEDAAFEKQLFARKLAEVALGNDFSRAVLDRLGDTFTMADLTAALAVVTREDSPREALRTRDGMIMLAKSNYETRFSPMLAMSERIIFPASPSEANGIEDARFVAFRDADDSRIYYATYTAFDGRVILPQLIETRDFLHFKMRTLNGPAAQNKGMALFPRRIDGLYAMISRQDNENVFIMFSDHVHFWYEAEPLFQPRQPWELVQMGNCGSPIETEAGWLVLTHGVGPMRKYCIGAVLLDLDDPRRVIGRLSEPLLKPDENEREGYVPNVVYTCGALVHAGRLILPYAMSDYATGFATVAMDELLERLT